MTDENNDIDKFFDTFLGKSIDPYFYEEHTGEELWVTADFREIPVSKMSSQHIINAINFFKRMYSDKGTKSILRGEDLRLLKNQPELKEKFVDTLSHVKAMFLHPRYKFLWKEALKRGLVNGK